MVENSFGLVRTRAVEFDNWLVSAFAVGSESCGGNVLGSFKS